MFYTLIILLMWLLLGASKVVFDFNPVLMAFVIAIVVDLFLNRGVFMRLRQG